MSRPVPCNLSEWAGAGLPWPGPGEKIQREDHERLAVVYVRQSTAQQVLDHQESTRLQYGLLDVD
jgi:hypothetical protein